MKYLLLVFSMSLAVTGQYLLKTGVLTTSLSPNLISVIKTLLNPFVFSGFVLYGLSSIIWLFVLQKFPLSVAYPALSLTYVVIIILSVLILKEPMTPFKVFGVLLILIGVYCLFK